MWMLDNNGRIMQTVTFRGIRLFFIFLSFSKPNICTSSPICKQKYWCIPCTFSSLGRGPWQTNAQSNRQIFSIYACIQSFFCPLFSPPTCNNLSLLSAVRILPFPFSLPNVRMLYYFPIRLSDDGFADWLTTDIPWIRIWFFWGLTVGFETHLMN
jgi:hypothetical protein